MIVYDCEIKKMIQGRNEARISGFEYCGGWGDHIGMGISVVCVYDMFMGVMHTLLPQDDQQHAELLQGMINTHDYVVGFNNNGFDNKLLAAHGFIIPAKKSYDIYEQVIDAAGLSDAPFYERKGYKLDDIARGNRLTRKTGDGGAQAPMLYQRGELQKLHDYCANDVAMTVDVLKLILEGKLLCPRTGALLPVTPPSTLLGSTQVGLF